MQIIISNDIIIYVMIEAVLLSITIMVLYNHHWSEKCHITGQGSVTDVHRLVLKCNFSKRKCEAYGQSIYIYYIRTRRLSPRAHTPSHLRNFQNMHTGERTLSVFRMKLCYFYLCKSNMIVTVTACTLWQGSLNLSATSPMTTSDAETDVKLNIFYFIFYYF